MSLVGSFQGGFDAGGAYGGFLHIIFENCDLTYGQVWGRFYDTPIEFSGVPISRINCKSCPSNDLNGEQ
jgi:hypothetical protein